MGGLGRGSAVDWNEPHAQRFKLAMDDDFNTPEAMAVLFDLANEVNKTASPQHAVQLKALGAVLGILQQDPNKFLQGKPQTIAPSLVINEPHFFPATVTQDSGADEESKIEALILTRADAKKSKNFVEADRIRKELLAAGVVLEDSAAGKTSWRRA